MEPITLVVTALTLGIAAGLKETANGAIKDAYASLKQLIERRYDIKLENLENKPDSKAQQDAIAETLQDKKAEDDPELIEQAAVIVEAVEQHAPAAAPSIGVNLVDVKAGLVRFKNVRAGNGGTGVRVQRGEFDTLEIGDVDVGTNPKN